MKENKELVLKWKEADIKLKSKETHCANLQLKASEDAAHISNLAMALPDIGLHRRRKC